MKLKRTLAFALAVFASVAVLAGCSSASRLIFLDEAKNDQTITDISFYGYKADDLDFIAMEDILQGFMRENKTLQVSYEGVKGQPYWDAFDLRGASDCLDDIIMMDQEHVLKYWDVLADVSDVVDLSVFNDLVRSQVLKADNTVRFVPLTLASYCMYVNYDLLKAHGKSVPKNYAEFADICDYFKDILKDKGLCPVILNQRRSLCTLIQGKSLFEIYRNPATSTEKMEEFNQDPAKLAKQLEKGFDFIQTWFDNGWADPVATLTTLQTSNDKNSNGDLWLFSRGEQPFLMSGGWAPQRLRKVLDAENKKMDFGLHPYPIEDDGCVLVMDINNCVAVNSKGKNVEAAKAFIAHLTKPDSIWEYCDGQACFSPLTKEKRIPSEKAVEPTREYYSNGRSVIGTNYQLNMSLDKYLMDVTKKLCEEMRDGKTPEQANEIAKALLLSKLTGSKEANA